MFISSKTNEFRKKIKLVLQGLAETVNVFIFEDDARPFSEKSEDVYRNEVLKSDFYVGLFRNEYSEATMDEYNLALDNGNF